MLPIFFMAKMLQILFPWMILGYLFYENLLAHSNGINVEYFQLTMLGFEIFLQITLIRRAA